MPNTFQKCLSHVGTACFIFRNAFPVSRRYVLFFRSAFPTSGRPTFFSKLPFPHRDGMFYFSEVPFPHRDGQLFFQNYLSRIGTSSFFSVSISPNICLSFYWLTTNSSNHFLPIGRKRLWPASLRWAVSVPFPPWKYFLRNASSRTFMMQPSS